MPLEPRATTPGGWHIESDEVQLFRQVLSEREACHLPSAVVIPKAAPQAASWRPKLRKQLKRALWALPREIGRCWNRRLKPLLLAPSPIAGPQQFDATVYCADSLSLAATESPDVSIVIPIYNHYQLTLACLHAIAAARCRTTFEVILIDDASQEAACRTLGDIPNLRVFRNAQNLGFVGSCNRGAREARGEFLHFLNNDTQVCDGWLDALVEAIRNDEQVGLVGSKLLSADGLLQEAGGIVWQDGTAWNAGRGQHRDSPEFCYARDVDYCSGASILTPRSLFLELGLFDESYRPGYYEDVDYAFRVRAAGRRVVYQPASEVFHLEGATSGRDLTSGMKQYQVRNQRQFLVRWRNQLSGHRPPGCQPEREKERSVARRVLWIDHRLPEPDQDAGSVRVAHLIQILQDLGSKVVFLPDNLQSSQPSTARLQAQGVEVVHAPHISSIADYLRQHGELFDHVILSRVSVAQKHLGDVKQYCPRAQVIFDTVDLHFLRQKRQADLEGTADDGWQQTLLEEMRVARSADVTFVVSTAEQSLLTSLAPQLRVEVISTIYEPIATPAPFVDRRGLLFIGGFEHPPNVDACRWLVEQVMPRVWSRDATLTLKVIGSKAPGEILSLASDRVEIVGYLPDVRPAFESVRLSVAPLRFGAGVKGKVNQSLALGVPCVATWVAAEGMGLVDGLDVLIGNDVESLAEAICRLHRDAELWQRISQKGLAAAKSRFSASAAQASLARCLSPVQESLVRQAA